ncbi:MAG: AMP-binding protein [Chloroflexi bacterium]|nr:AMP-binding protein [Chloroflexota bacterium]
MLDHLYDVVRRRAAAAPDAIALGSQQGLIWRTVDSRELLARVDRLADELAALGVGEGDRVIAWLPSSWRTPVYFFACWKLGAVIVPFDREMNPDAASRIITSVEPRLILVDDDEHPAWAPAELVRAWWEPGDSVGAEPALPAFPNGWTQPGEDLAALFFTSGTTGNPKGCMITHLNLLSQIDAASDIIPLDTTCRLASILPLSHLFEFTCGMLYPLARGAAIHYVPSRRGPDVLRVFQEQRITHMVTVPQMLTIMGQTLDGQLQEKLPAQVYRAATALAPKLPMTARRKLFWPVHRKLGGHLRLLAAGGAALSPETQVLWERIGVRVVQGYGASECSPIVSGGRPDGSTPLGSVGKPLRDVEVRLNDGGELLVRGPNVMRGYWKDPARTAEVLTDGWYHTGDLARIDGQGNIFLAGRAKDLIVLPSGMNVWPEDVEDALCGEPSVKDATVIGVPTPGGGMVLHAYLLPAGPNAREADLGELVAQVNGRLAQHQRVATASWWPEPDFPRTSTLKVRRHLIPPPAAVEAVEVDATLASDDPVGQAIANVARVPAVRDEQTLAELGLDSLALVELGLALEDKTGKSVPEAAVTPDMTVGQVRERMASAPAQGVGIGSAPGRAKEQARARQPLWPYTWGRALRPIRLPFDLLFNAFVTRTLVIGGEHLQNLPPRVILAGTHRAYADFPLLAHALRRTPARGLADRLVVATRAGGFDEAGLLSWYGMLAWGLYPLRQYGEQDVSLRGLARLAEQGNPVVIFPQGRHTHPEDEVADRPDARFKPGVGHLAIALDAVIVPFGLAGTEQVMPIVDERYDGPKLAGIPVKLAKGPLAIAFGPPLERRPGETPLELAARLQDVCFALAREAEAALAAIRKPAPPA